MNLNQILYGPPGTGKTFATIDRAIEIINPDFYNEVKKMPGTEIEKREALKKEFRRLLIKDWNNDIDGQIVFTTFHQSMSYEDFVEGIKPETIDQQVTYKIEDGIFKRLCAKAVEKRVLTKFDESYTQFVEEVESKGFIELLTPVHKKKFHVTINANETSVATPQTENANDMGVTKKMVRKYIADNIYIIGTMNTADRSVEALDTALRRRFIFSEMMPDSNLLEDKFVEVINGIINLKELLEVINKRVIILLDKDHQIGHTYLMDIKTLKDLSQTFENSIIPLLQEYFYGDFGKIGLVLGNSFVEKYNQNLTSFASFSDYDSSRIDSFTERYTYVIKPKEEWDFKSIL